MELVGGGIEFGEGKVKKSRKEKIIREGMILCGSVH